MSHRISGGQVREFDRGVGRHVSPPRRAEGLARLFALRALVHSGAAAALLTDSGYARPDVAAALGLEERCPADGDYSRGTATAALRQLLDEAEESAAANPPAFPSPLARNLERLAELANLSSLDRRIMGLTALMRADRTLGAAGEALGPLTLQRVYEVVSDMLRVDLAEARAALGPDGRLHRSGLLCVDASAAYNFASKFDFPDQSFPERLIASDLEPIGLLAGVIARCQPAGLTLDDFEHVKLLPAALAYLRGAIATGRTGANMLLHGRPGVGKTQLALLLAAACEVPLHEVPSSDAAGDALSGVQRARGLRCAQAILAGQQHKSMLLFDELEDLAVPSASGDRLCVGKSFFNRLLEETSVPTIYTSNSVAALDPASIRRFDVIIEVKAPEHAKRKQMIRRLVGDLIGDEAVADLAGREAATPAVLTRASRVIELASGAGAIEPAEREITYRRLVGQTLRALGDKRPLEGAVDGIPGFYDPRTTNADCDLLQVADGLMRAGAGRLLMWGPPGTGKTAVGRWLSQRLGVSLQLERGSTLLGGVVGQTEANIAAAFRRARDARALLMIDECETFLASRQQAQRSWEISQVNEMLVQMESYDGLLLMSTNLVDVLDEAVRRRFDLVVRVGYLKPEQSLALLERHCAALGLPAPCDPARRTLAGLGNLTPGDFQLLARQHRLRPIADAIDFAARLRGESRHKDGPARQPMGFVA